MLKSLVGFKSFWDFCRFRILSMQDFRILRLGLQAAVTDLQTPARTNTPGKKKLEH